MADNNSFFSKKLKSPSSFDGIFDGDGYNSFYVAGVEVARVDAQGLKLSSGTAIRQGDAPAGGVVLSHLTTTSTNTPLTLASSQSGQWWSNFGASAMQAVTLPVIGTDIGLQFGGLISDTDGLRVNAGAGQTVRVTLATTTNLSTVGGYAQSVTNGAGIVFTAVTTNAYVGRHVTGIWSVLE